MYRCTAWKVLGSWLSIYMQFMKGIYFPIIVYICLMPSGLSAITGIISNFDRVVCYLCYQKRACPEHCQLERTSQDFLLCFKSVGFFVFLF